jgi:hypothetical protein
MLHLARQIGYYISDCLARKDGPGSICVDVCKTRKRNATHFHAIFVGEPCTPL